MNTTILYLRYAITALIAYLSIDDVGPLSALIVFVVANAIWTAAEEAIIDRHNIFQTDNWRRNQK